MDDTNRRKLLFGGAVAVAAIGMTPTAVAAVEVKISAFPDAATPMASADRVTGLQGGANVNFSQTQILTGASGGAAGNGNPIYLYGGAGGYPGGGDGGGSVVNGGRATNGQGGSVFIQGGASDLGSGGYVKVAAGNSMDGSSFGLMLYGGFGTHGGNHGGNITIEPGDGDAGATPGFLKFGANVTVAASDSGLASGQVWINSTTRLVAVKA